MHMADAKTFVANAPAWIDLSSQDAAASRDFYSKLFGWKIDVQGPEAANYGLAKAGGNLFQATANSGTPAIGVPDSAGRGQIATGFLEGSNVDLAQQFTNMIMAERGFQANSRVITTSDEILQDLVNLKH